jgi:serine-type D-Ala-D-Ala carboxypeptidase (penicillin-binding protein 5/6)
MGRTGKLIWVIAGLVFFFSPVTLGNDQGELKKPVIQAPECKSAVVMETTTGNIVYALNAHQPLPPASMVKMMVIYIVMDSIREGTLHYTDLITTSAHASKMGGSQVYLKHGEQFTVEELLQAVMIQSANDASMALSEYLGGSSKGFVDMMNIKAQELGMTDTVFHSPHGLPPGRGQEPDRVSAHDLAVLARALVNEFPEVLQWSQLDKKAFRDGKFIMTNTNRLVKTYPGCDGIKTGYYREAGFGVTATATRNGIRMISVIMGCDKGKIRFAEAARLLSWGFTQFKVVTVATKNQEISQSIPVVSGVRKTTRAVISGELTTIVPKNHEAEIEHKLHMAESLQAPIKSGTECGSIIFMLGDKELGELPVVTAEDIQELGWWGKLLRWVGIT